MSPGTNIGAAHPVNIGAKQDSANQVMMEKVTNDAVSYIRSIAEKNKRNPEWVEDAVRNSVSITETEALQKNVIDLITIHFGPASLFAWTAARFRPLWAKRSSRLVVPES